MIERLWAWITGYVIIKLKGADLEQLLNRIARQGYGIWDLERVTANIMIGKIRIKHFKNIRPLLRGLNIRVGIVGRRGLPFLAAKLQKRKMLMLGLIAVLFCLYYLTGFIWFVEISGSDEISVEDIAAVLAERGVVPGVRKVDLNQRSLENTLLTQFPDFSWVGINIKGVLMNIEVVERTSPELAEVQYGDIVAAENGLITQILPFRGTPVVSAGSTVKKGDVLIFGEYYDQYGRRMPGAAEGIVRARVWFDAIGEAALSKTVELKTGNRHVNYRIEAVGLSFVLGGKVPFNEYATTLEVWQLQIRGFKLPFSLTKQIYDEVYYETVPISTEDAKTLALERAWQQLEAQGIDREQVADTQIEEYLLADQHGIRVGLIVELERDIAEFRPKL
ncbi:MAG: sporulation protein YqfD [Candidatus Wallacebacter cryptica]|nr:sporulation protein YqfD [Bacillota bacterium]